MGNETKPAEPSDEDLGAALRKIATTLGQDEFEYYARRFVEWASDDTFLALLAKRRVHRVKVFVQPPDRLDGILEHLVEMVMKAPVACVAPFEPIWSPDDVAFLIGLAVTVPDGDGSVPKRLRSIAERIAGG